MKTRLALIAFLGVFSTSALVADNPKDEANAHDLKKLQGKWVGEWLVVAGKKTSFADNKLSVSLVFKGDSVAAESSLDGKAAPKSTGKVTLDATKTPHTMDVAIRDGGDKGKTVQAIYAFENDMLKLCTALPGQERPTDFKESTDKGHTLMFLKRSK